jgi:hypothetical protein
MRSALQTRLTDQLGIPVKFIGLGETPQDIETFDPKRFVNALFSSTTPPRSQGGHKQNQFFIKPCRARCKMTIFLATGCRQCL